VIPMFLDLRTGKTAKGDDMSFFWWTEGNGACDCNRCIAFGLTHEDVGELGTCLGCRRFVAIDAEGDLEYDEDHKGTRTPHTKEQVLIAMNSGYGT
jgi:hypothetical protein